MLVSFSNLPITLLVQSFLAQLLFQMNTVISQRTWGKEKNTLQKFLYNFRYPWLDTGIMIIFMKVRSLIQNLNFLSIYLIMCVFISVTWFSLYWFKHLLLGILYSILLLLFLTQFTYFLTYLVFWAGSSLPSYFLLALCFHIDLFIC